MLLSVHWRTKYKTYKSFWSFTHYDSVCSGEEKECLEIIVSIGSKISNLRRERKSTEIFRFQCFLLVRVSRFELEAS